MRERFAIAIALATVLLLVGLSALFAARQNRGDPLLAEAPRTTAPLAVATDDADAPPRPAPLAASAPLASDSVRGRAVFTASGCARCHSVEGVGSRRYPLDGVGARRTREALRAWTVAEGATRDSLSPSAVRSKQRYAAMPPAEMDALLDYLATLTRAP